MGDIVLYNEREQVDQFRCMLPDQMGPEHMAVLTEQNAGKRRRVVDALIRQEMGQVVVFTLVVDAARFRLVDRQSDLGDRRCREDDRRGRALWERTRVVP